MYLNRCNQTIIHR